MNFNQTITHFSKAMFKVLLAVALIVPTLSYAVAPSDKQLMRFAVVSQFDEQFSDGIKIGVLQTLQAGMTGHPKWHTLSSSEQAKAKQALEQYVNQVVSEIDTPELRQAMLARFVAVSKKHYDADEIEAMIGFYSTPIGQRVVSKQNAMINDFMQSVNDYMQTPAINQQIESIAQKHAQELKKNLKNIGLGD